jgi:uncharacterized membrane protein YidH (DUF202 family)
MPEKLAKENKPAESRDRRVHMANERTFLAWIRTSIGIMAFGFVVERFALFMEHFSNVLGTRTEIPSLQHGHGYSSIFGIILIGFGVLISVLAFVRYKKMQKQIDAGSFAPSSGLDLFLTLSVAGMGVFLIIFLIRSI